MRIVNAFLSCKNFYKECTQIFFLELPFKHSNNMTSVNSYPASCLKPKGPFKAIMTRSCLVASAAGPVLDLSQLRNTGGQDP